VSGSLVPDATGQYEPIEDTNGYAAWGRVAGGWFLYYDTLNASYVIAGTLGADNAGETDYWIKEEDPTIPQGQYFPQGTATSDATFTTT
jgi:hypothetical protein